MHAQPLEARLAHLEGAFVQFGERLNSIDHRLDTLENVMESRFSLVDQRFALLDQRITWLIGIIVGTWITTILTILFHH